jgi:hypothetical protein
METNMRFIAIASLALAATAGAQAGGAPGAPAPAQQPTMPMGFFITSVGKGDGANLGGLAGADAHCQALAQAAGAAGTRVWRAYLSAMSAQGPVNARDRIGNGPWANQKGQVIAWNVADLHGDIQRDRNSINKEFALNEKGVIVFGRGDLPNPNQHDILTGSDSFGRLPVGSPATTTCNNWTSNAAGSAIVGHHDRSGGGNSSWNAAHGSRSCSQNDLVATGGAGLFYCFAL